MWMMWVDCWKKSACISCGVCVHMMPSYIVPSYERARRVLHSRATALWGVGAATRHL